MDGFGDSFVPNGVNGVEDPAAEFLAREQSEMAGIDDLPIVAPADEESCFDELVQNRADQPQPNVLEGFGQDFVVLDSGENNALSGENNVLDLEQTEPKAELNEFMVDVVEEVKVEEPVDQLLQEDLGIMGEMPPVMPPLDSQTLMERAITPVPRIEPEPIRLWREEHQQKLVEKDAAEEKAKEALREKAVQELVDWYKQHDDQMGKTREANRCAERELVADQERPVTGAEWERISKLCDFGSKSARHSRDVSRMRSIILQLKQNPPIKA